MTNDPDADPDLQPIEAIYDALDREDPLGALRLAREAARRTTEGDPVLHFLAGVALLELDRPDEAARELRRATDLDPDDAEFRANLALALFRGCEFESGRVESARALESDPSLPDAHYVHGLLLERGGRLDEADDHLKRAAKLDPDAFRTPRRLAQEEFDRCLDRAAGLLTDEFREHLNEVTVIVDDLPPDAILRDELPPLDPELLGLFVGVSLGDRSVMSVGGEVPPRILLFKRNLERSFPDPAELTEQIARTLHHELGHYLGLDEDELAAIGLE
jgi:predicted Zn-dependent protease with MMP-like domain